MNDSFDFKAQGTTDKSQDGTESVERSTFAMPNVDGTLLNSSKDLKEESEELKEQLSLQVVEQFTVFMNYKELDYLRLKFLKYCVYCDAVKPPRAHHCR